MILLKVHEMSVLRGKTDVRDLNFVGDVASLFCHGLWPTRPLPNHRSRALANAFPLGGSLRCRVASPTFWVPPATHLHGFCPTDMAGESAGYRRLPQCAATNPLTLGLPGACGQVGFGRCQQLTRLAAVGGFGQDFHAQSLSALRRGGAWARHQALLRSEPQCGEDSDIDRGGRLPYGGYHSQ
jgi:hypothetical protein